MIDNQDNIARGLRALLILIGVACAVAVASPPAWAVPSFAQQTGQPCAACHVGAFGPQLKPYGRDFKLFGYQSSDGKSHVPPIALTALTSLTHTQAAQSPAPAGFRPNDNVALDQISMFYAGQAPMGWGAFVQLTYDGVARSLRMDNADLRRASDLTMGSHDLLLGVDLNNNPTLEDVWNSTPAWGFPYSSSALTPAAAASLVDGGLGGKVVGAGGYVMLDGSFYGAASLYGGLNPVTAGRLGEGVANGSDRYAGAIPYARAAYVHDFGARHTLELGVFGLRAQRYPGGVIGQGFDTLTDWAADATYQFVGSPIHVVSAHAVFIHESQALDASSALFGTNRRDQLSTARADLSYGYKDTLTPSVQLFLTTGSADPVRDPDGLATRGMVAELAWTPYGKPDSPVYWANARLALQYVAYSEFNGERRGAADNNTVYLNLWLALAPFGASVRR